MDNLPFLGKRRRKRYDPVPGQISQRAITVQGSILRPLQVPLRSGLKEPLNPALGPANGITSESTKELRLKLLSAGQSLDPTGCGGPSEFEKTYSLPSGKIAVIPSSRINVPLGTA